MEDKEKMGPENPEEEKYKSFFEMGEGDDWEENLEDEEVREKIREHKVKSLKERKRMGDKGDTGPKNIYRKK